jgi:MtfA peptidase
MSIFRDWRRRRWLRHYPLSDALWARVIARLPILDGYEAAEIARLRELTTIFMREKAFTATHDLVLTEAMQARIAVQACVPVMNLGLDWYRGWETVIVYPGKFGHRRRETGEDGLVHEWDQVMSGESWELGPVILSWADVTASGRGEGYNVVIHELAHKLDMRNGAPDGFPPLHRGMEPRQWSAAFSAAFEDLNRRIDAGEPSAIDPYAAEDPAEFFAVLSETFFERPELLQATYPEVYAQMQAFYRQDPQARAAARQTGDSDAPSPVS